MNTEELYAELRRLRWEISAYVASRIAASSRGESPDLVTLDEWLQQEAADDKRRQENIDEMRRHREEHLFDDVDL